MTRPSILPDPAQLLGRERAALSTLGSAAREALVSAALQHGLLAAVAGRIPAEEGALRRRFERMAGGTRLRDARSRQVLEEVLEALSAAGIVPVALKGPVLADRIYPEPALRASTDLDLLVAEPQLLPAAEVLSRLGFARAPALHDAYQLRRHHHLQLHRRPEPNVELHFAASSSCGARFPTAELLARARPHRTPAGSLVQVLAPEDELLVLATHAAGHMFERKGWLLDLALFVQAYPELDWAAVADRAAAYRCRRALSFALRKLRALGEELPRGPQLAPETARQRLADALAAAATRRADKLGAVLGMAFQLVLRDRVRTVPGLVLAEAGWVIRRRAVRLRRHLASPRAARAAMAPAGGSPEAPPGGDRVEGTVRRFWEPVRGTSMLPTLREGDEVLLETASSVSVGDVVVVRSPVRRGTLLHRVARIEGGHVVTRGDACPFDDPPVSRSQVLYRAAAVRRGERLLTVPPAPGPAHRLGRRLRHALAARLRRRT